MEKHKISTSMRFFFMLMSSVIWLGIAFTGFDAVSWILYLPAVLLLFAAITAICPGLIISKMIFDKQEKESEDFA